MSAHLTTYDRAGTSLYLWRLPVAHRLAPLLVRPINWNKWACARVSPTPPCADTWTVRVRLCSSLPRNATGKSIGCSLAPALSICLLSGRHRWAPPFDLCSFGRPRALRCALLGSLGTAMLVQSHRAAPRDDDYDDDRHQRGRAGQKCVRACKLSSWTSCSIRCL